MIKFLKKVVFKNKKLVYNACKLYCNNIKVQSEKELLATECYETTQSILSYISYEIFNVFNGTK